LARKGPRLDKGRPEKDSYRPDSIKTGLKKIVSEKIGPTRTRLDNIFTRFVDKNGRNQAPCPSKIRKMFDCGAEKEEIWSLPSEYLKIFVCDAEMKDF